MYQCNLVLYFIGIRHRISELLKGISSPSNFTYEYLSSDTPRADMLANSDIIIADISGTDTALFAAYLSDNKKSGAELIVIADKAQFGQLTELMTSVTDIWTLPLSDEEIVFRFTYWQKSYKTEKDCRQAEHFLDATINSVPNLIWYKTKDGVHEKVNDSFCQVVGKSKEQVQGQRHAYIWNVEHDDPACIESERIVMEKRETCVSEEAVQTGEGTRLLTTYKSPLYDCDGSVMGTVGVAIDITRERAYAEELIKKNETLETLFTTMDCGVICHSTDGSRIISINRAALNILGYNSQEELMNDGFFMIASTVEDDDKEELINSISSLKNSGDNVSVEYRVRRNDGTVTHVMGNIKLIEENGELFYQRYMVDCTAQKQKEEHKRRADERRQMELLYALSIEYNLVCFFNLDDAKGQVLRINDCKNHILEPIFSGVLDLRKCMESYISAAVYDDDKDKLRKALLPEQLEKELSDKDLYTVTYRTVCCGEMRYFRMKAVRAGEWNESRGVVIGFCSVDKEIRAEMEKKAILEDALSQANRANKAKTTFLSNMSHDIRTPMNAIIGFTTLAVENADNSEKVREYLKKIDTSGKHLLGLINDVLDMSHIESGKVHLKEQPCRLSEILGSLNNIVQADVQAKHLNLNIDAANILNDAVYCDKLRINQILLNLLSNAVKYTEQNGRISLNVTEKTGAPKGYSNYEFRVKDNGIGMSEDFVSHIFEPFERERNSTVSGIKGTGLGMAITKNIVDLMHGTIEVKSRQGEGTECIVLLTLRLDNEHSEKETVKVPSETTEHIRGGRILLVEDNDLNQEIAMVILENSGFSVEVADNGQIALDMVKNSDAGYYDLILMDIQMPVMNGYDATKAIRGLDNKKLASIPIIAMTANAFEEDKQNALRSGMNGHISKPIDIEMLLSTLDGIFQN